MRRSKCETGNPEGNRFCDHRRGAWEKGLPECGTDEPAGELAYRIAMPRRRSVAPPYGHRGGSHPGQGQRFGDCCEFAEISANRGAVVVRFGGQVDDS